MVNQVCVSNWYYASLYVYCFNGFWPYFIYPSLCFTGVDLQESGHRDWLIQALFEYTLDMKLSTDYQTGWLCLSALHESSGNSSFWSFWIANL